MVPCLEFRRVVFGSMIRHTRCYRDWSSDVCSSDLSTAGGPRTARGAGRCRRPSSSPRPVGGAGEGRGGEKGRNPGGARPLKKKKKNRPERGSLLRRALRRSRNECRGGHA